MINNIKNTLTIVFVFTVFLTATSFAQEKQDSSMKGHNMKMHKTEMMKDHKMNMMNDSTHHKMHNEMNCTDIANCENMKADMDHSKMMNMKDHKMKMMSDSTHHKMHGEMNCTDAANCEKMKADMDHKMMDSSNQNMTKEKGSIVREGVIDLKAIDKNNDGKVFQDMMDYNVISDKAGKCPLCGMKLKEVSLDKAKDTLLKSGHKVK